MAQPHAIDSQGPVPGKAPQPGHNNLAAEATAYVRRVEQLLEDLEAEKADYQKAANTIRQDIKLVYDDAQRDGVPVKELKAVVEVRRLERKADACRDGLGTSERETFDQIGAALGDFGDTPLGQAALERAGM
jgi:uncharacterized protein (UPF0335 family)